MLTPCSGENGCGAVVRQNISQTGGRTDLFNTPPSTNSAPGISFSQMTDVTGGMPVPQIPGTTSTPTGTGTIVSNFPMPGIRAEAPPLSQNMMNPSVSSSADGAGSTNSSVDDPDFSGETGAVPEGVLPEAPQFAVPNNPLLPPGYQEILNYENLQYLNGFLRTQIGRYIRVDQLVGSSLIEDRYGYLIGVGINYILLQEMGTGNISVVDYFSIKYVYIYFSTPALPTRNQ